MDVDDLFEVATVCEISDSCDQLGVPCVRTGEIRPVYSGCAPFAGTVTTIALRPGRGTRLGSLIQIFEDTEDDAVLIDLGGRTDLQCWGSVLATAAMRFEVRAALVNGSARDADQLAGLGFPTFARGTHPASMRGRLALTDVGCDVVVDGRPVTSGCAVAADSNGVVFFPREHADKVFDFARQIAAAEQRLLDRIRSVSRPTAEVLDTILP
ncbi:hypothetical protein NE236_10640 [Actinoallomurus purpureus]|uniref:RraA family protein n=1 Tax=Actinoallomurus purpureus TaxID=478114 RepID=UPI0020923E88|nr:hypothetical protein [Actinoallomurus purpureus]MCO6005439.1 hypothetical protein [Actinoallomurus purpureus]